MRRSVLLVKIEVISAPLLSPPGRRGVVTPIHLFPVVAKDPRREGCESRDNWAAGAHRGSSTSNALPPIGSRALDDSKSPATGIRCPTGSALLRRRDDSRAHEATASIDESAWR